MKRNTTVRYFLWISGLVLFCLVLNFGADWLFDVHSRTLMTRLGLDHQAAEGIVMVVFNLLAMPLVLLGAWGVARRLMAPIRRIATAAEDIRAGRLKQRIPCDVEDDELGRLVALLNGAFDEFDRNLERQKRFAANAAHQLRTPLSAMRSEGEICLSHSREAGEYREALESMLERVDGLSRLCEQLLELSRLDAPALRSQFVLYDPAAALQSLCDDFTVVASARAVTLRVQVDAGIHILGIPELFTETAANLLDNAIRHAPDGGDVQLTWGAREAANAVLRVVDDGPGIPEDLRSMLFEPFAQGISGKGTGLGLAIVAEIARLHGARAEICNRVGSGACVCIAWPVACAAS